MSGHDLTPDQMAALRLISEGYPLAVHPFNEATLQRRGLIHPAPGRPILTDAGKAVLAEQVTS